MSLQEATCYPRAVCGGQCVNLRGDPANCGRCGNRCGTGQVCAFGQCLTGPCPIGTRSAGTGALANSCIFFPTDAMQCSSFNMGVCTEGTVCDASEGSSGACRAHCYSGMTPCDRECVNLQTSLAHCGACGRSCMPGQLCVQGNCRDWP